MCSDDVDDGMEVTYSALLASPKSWIGAWYDRPAEK